MSRINFDFYGLTIQIQSKNQGLADEILRDFSYFQSGRKEGEVRIDLDLTAPVYEGFSDLPAQFITPRNVCYKDGTRTIIDYSGKAICIHDRKKKTCVIQGLDFDLVREICYLFVLSVTGQHFDKRGLNRVHALGISRGGRAALLMMPSGGGKSTMALRLLSRPGFKLLSDDSPLVDRSGRVLAFPLRVGIPPDHNNVIDPKYIRTLNRMEFDPKTVIDIEAFRERLADDASPALLLVGERNLGRVSRIEPLSRVKTFKSLTNNMVVGLGLYQGLEFLLERGSWEVFLKIGLLWSRLRNALGLLRRTECYRFVIGRDLELNTACLTEFLEERLPYKQDGKKE